MQQLPAQEMASQSQGIQQLLAAEKKAAEAVAEAKKRKAIRLKQAKEEAQAEIEAFVQECELKFNEKLKQQSTKEDFQAEIDKDTSAKLEKLEKGVALQKKKVVSHLLSKVYDIRPELHQNYALSEAAK